MGLLKICIGVIWTTALENAQYILHLFIELLVYSVMLLSNFYVFLNLIFREKNNWWILPFIQHPNSSLFLWLWKHFYISFSTTCKCLLFCSKQFDYFSKSFCPHLHHFMFSSVSSRFSEKPALRFWIHLELGFAQADWNWYFNLSTRWCAVSSVSFYHHCKQGFSMCF